MIRGFKSDLLINLCPFTFNFQSNTYYYVITFYYFIINTEKSFIYKRVNVVTKLVPNSGRWVHINLLFSTRLFCYWAIHAVGE